MTSKLPMVVVASAGGFQQVKVYLPQDKLQEHPMVGWTCEWCDWLGVAPAVDDLPHHECLSNLDGLRVDRG